MYGPMHQKIMDALAKIGTQPICFLVNTHLHGDHTVGNEAMAKLGTVIVSHEMCRRRSAIQTSESMRVVQWMGWSPPPGRSWRFANENTEIIPGHLGPVVGFGEIRQQLVMFTAVRDRISSAIRAGKTLEQVVALKPTADFDESRMGGAITPDRFETLVYTDLARGSK
jgi:hypothetical protein